ncbi:MAG: hypothetical protein Q8Q09_09330 [Deltaproteobacteria bacterium]|nr:hypothetical protein [Deltaproteobacteria bacterium]
MALRTRTRLWLLAALATITLAMAGCARRIGDGCAVDTDCSINNDRRCDTSQPSGYCTIAECDRNSCPSDSLCVEFFSDSARRARRFCMAPCTSDGDCRAQYKCQMPNAVGLFQSCPDNMSSVNGCTRLIDDAVGPSTTRERTGYCAPPTTMQ